MVYVVNNFKFSSFNFNILPRPNNMFKWMHTDKDLFSSAALEYGGDQMKF